MVVYILHGQGFTNSEAERSNTIFTSLLRSCLRYFCTKTVHHATGTAVLSRCAASARQVQGYIFSCPVSTGLYPIAGLLWEAHDNQGLRMDSRGCACAGSDVPLVVKLFCMAHKPTPSQSWFWQKQQQHGGRPTIYERCDEATVQRTARGLERWSNRLSIGPCNQHHMSKQAPSHVTFIYDTITGPRGLRQQI